MTLYSEFCFDFFFLILHDHAPRIPTHSPCAPIHPRPAPMSFKNNFAWRIVFWPVREHGAQSHRAILSHLVMGDVLP